MTTRDKYMLGALLALNLIILGIFASFRMVGIDEGVYLSAARMVGLGKELYIDFFYPQMALLPLTFSSIALHGWTSFWIFRAFAVGAGFISAVLLFMIVIKTTRNIKAALFGLAMYTFSGIIISVHSVFESLVFANLLSLGAFYFWLVYYDKKQWSHLFLSGMFLAALINLRATFIVLLPLYIWSVWMLSENSRPKHLAILCASLIPLSVPSLIFLIKSAGSFIYDTFIFQIFRESDRSLGAILQNKISTVLKTVIDPHLLIILILTIISIRLLLRSKRIANIRDLAARPEGMALMNLTLIAIVYLLPHPILRYYVEQFLAFGIIVLAFGIEEIGKVLSRVAGPLQKRMLIGIIAALYVLSILPYVAVYVYGLRKTDRRYLLAEVKKVTAQMLKFGVPGDTVLTEWAGYHFFTGQVPLPQTEILGFQFPLPLDHDGYMKLKLCDNVYLKDRVSTKTPALVVTLNRPPDYYAAALHDGYDSVFYSETVTMFKRK